jgi:hypothetical protein
VEEFFPELGQDSTASTEGTGPSGSEARSIGSAPASPHTRPNRVTPRLGKTEGVQHGS